ncbi:MULTISPECIES: chromosome segregation protein SMC [unclassified Paenibacillus]|uniref:chromosome segregation protein SMC n=1 Tax=unclassified Paenibacillus TaxID=185978 RepID=UPI001AE69090|nr:MULTISPECIES: chromosome segregation protein SMC [unclassified Paenibacillus]MBP1156044.1 chromosome segregation protein [Paenibacillus sp. PvP091]MBP1168570.1 chromosome segregation protein [Paenibacillus sp. PvR098]MBP2439598.1 chromosome segregation protein [Paenibacillus sp. PvP052]
MFLRRIELSGFKSFADRTELEFVQGITAVVGPNGSGKSNISDGIRWVLGEQSARSLRGGKMEDIIFAGSDARKAVNYGEVSLTLDNASQSLPLEYNEVTVTRRVHRSGESEYLINKQPCRLKDITELFMDTGIGKEAYSIIGQGRIEEILSTKSEDRRGIFEEASGIVKYKSRKKETEKKLQETEQNLLRIHDLVTELEDQLDPLRIQSEKAVRFKELKEQLKSSEIAMYVYQIEQIYATWTETNAQLEELRQAQLELSGYVSVHDAQLETDRLETRQLEESIEQLQEHLLQLSEDFEKCEGHGEVLKERKKNYAANRNQLELTVRQQEQRLLDKEAEIAGLRDKLEVIAGRLSETEAKLKAEEDRLLGVTGGLSSAEEDRLKSELLEVLNDAANARNEARYAEQQLETLTRRMDRLGDEHRKWAEQQKSITERKAKLEQRLQEAVDGIAEVRNRYLELSQGLKAKQALSEEAQATVRKWEQKLDAMVSRRDTMREMANDYDGFMHGVKEVLKAKNRSDLRGIHGAVAELVMVPAHIELAVETALGGALQHIVVDNEVNGREAIAFLKRRQLGRATFLPLDVIRGRSISESEQRQVQGMEGFVGIAVDLVQFDEPYRQIAGSLLGNVIIAQSLEVANRIAARVQYRYRVVTLEGDVVNPGGSMSGGSQQKKTTSLLSRQRQIEDMDKEIAQSESQLRNLREKAEQMRREIGEASKELDELRALGESRRIEEQQVRAMLEPLKNEAKQVTEQLALYGEDGQSLTEERTELEKRRVVALETLERLQGEEAAMQKAIREAEIHRKASESAKEELQTQLTDLKVTVASQSQEKQSLQEQDRRLRMEREALKAELEANRKLRHQLESDMANHDQESVLQIEQLNDLKLRKQLCAEQLDMKRAERAGWIAKLEAEESKTKEQRTKLRQVEEQLHQTEVRVNRLDVELENLLKKLSEDYELSYELAKVRYPVPEDVLGTQNKVRELKREIAILGEVNLGAIEEHQRVNERYQFLSEQKNDLVEAKTALYMVIREMDEEMGKRFRLTFDAIRSHFVVVFAKLFGGGRADLILSEPDNLLDTGIEIVAQPPGKKLQNLQLLSGGERALTAIALLFSIIRVKPVPFCVLDEVEAALDEANVARFAEYLREFSQQTQFIVVTHRKGTMEEADVLYGVTMEEGGVSKLVSVRLEEDEAIMEAG